MKIAAAHAGSLNLHDDLPDAGRGIVEIDQCKLPLP
jgi:hypothetical protein